VSFPAGLLFVDAALKSSSAAAAAAAEAETQAFFTAIAQLCVCMVVPFSDDFL
jgi:hypothetical protein